jgi:multicomponent Na+:H+ antiporter subunit G
MSELPWNDVVAAVLMIFGTLLMIIGGIGMIRMPDLYLRMSAATKVSTLGVASLLLAVAVHKLEEHVAAQAIATIIFLLLTVPLGAHIIGRAAYRTDMVHFADDTVFDDKRRRESDRHATTID